MAVLNYLIRNGSSSGYHKLPLWPAVTINHDRANARDLNAILARFNEQHIGALADDFKHASRTLLGLPAAQGEIRPEEVTAEMAESCARFIEALAVTPTASALALSTEIYCLAYISIAKQGNITDNKLNSICNAIIEETGRPVNLSVEEVKAFSASFMPFINATNARPICEGLRNNMTAFSLCFSITMQQSIRSGMTAYWAVWDALTTYPGFSWGTAMRYIPQDFQRCSDAVTAVGNNQYYGFSKDLGVAKHTNYLSLSWLACKLLIKADPPAYAALSMTRVVAFNQ